MNSIKTAATAAAIVWAAALGASPASADVISNPVNNYPFGYLAGAPLQGGQQTQFIGETFTASTTGSLTDFQFTLGNSNITSVYGAVYAWDGSRPTTLLWQSPTVSGGAGVLDFSPTGVNLTQGQTYVAFLSTYGIANNTGTATVGSCLSFSGCNNVNDNPYLGDLVWKTIYDGTMPLQESWSKATYLDATFAVTIASPVPEPTTWAMLILGFAGVGFMAYRRRNQTAALAA